MTLMKPTIVTLTLILSAILIVFLHLGTQRFHNHAVPSSSEVLHHFLFFNVLKDGRVNVFFPSTERVPPAAHPANGVKIKDVRISSNVSARVFLPSSSAKLPLMLYIHGGAFCMQSAFNAAYTSFVSSLAAKAQILVVSVEYGLFPARPIPACYDDSWEALRWIASHVNGSGPDPWLNQFANLQRLFIGGDSAGANICHTIAVRAASLGGVLVEGMIMIHPYFAENDKMWMYMCPTNEGPRDRRMKPAAEDLARVASRRVLVIVAGKDVLREAGVGYAEELVKSGWNGTVETAENKEREHCFHLINDRDVEAVANMRRMVSFIHHQKHD